MAKLIHEEYIIKAPHIKLLNQKLLDISSGRTKRLIVNMPPRHGKTQLISKYFPVWYLGNNPSKNIIITAYQSDLAEEWGEYSKELFEAYGNTLFGNTLNRSSKSKKRWRINNNTGSLNAIGMRGGLTGKGADVLIIDDPIKNDEQAMSITYREKAWNWFQATSSTRLSKNGSIIIVMTRWHHDDLVGRLLEEQRDLWDVVNLPAIATEQDIIGRNIGDALFPSLYTKDDLLNIKKTIGDYWFSSLYQQEPISGEHQIFKKDYWQYTKLQNDYRFVGQYWDTAFKDKQQNDYSACITIGVTSGGDIHIINVFKGKLEFPILLEKVKELYNLYKPMRLGVEDAGSGQDILSSLKHNTHIPIKPIPTMNKVVRAHRVTPLYAQKRVFMIENSSWIPDYIKELEFFPKFNHDDQVDCTTLGLDDIYNIADSYLNAPNSTYNPIRKDKKDKFSKY